MTLIKDTIRELFIYLHLDVTKNLKYDRLTRQIMKTVLKKNDNCIDIGCHKGEMLHLMLKYSPDGIHYAFEPIPYLYNELENTFKSRAKIFPYALSDSDGKTTFQLVRNAPAYSGIKKRRYDIANPEIDEIVVEMRALDNVLSADERIHFIKIDVEGAEFGVLNGAINLLKRNKPVVLFECGKGASDYYGTTPGKIYDFISNDVGLNIYTLIGFIKGRKPLSKAEFEDYYESNKEYYFIAMNQVSIL